MPKKLKRKSLRNKHIAKAKVVRIKRLISKPTIKNIDIEEIKKSFSTKKDQ